jgi:hypothetical protein
MIYTLVPFVKMLDLEKSVVRLPSALFHIIASVIFALLVEEYLHNKWLSLAGGFVFSVVPWIFPVSRTASGGYTPMLLGITAGLVWLLKSLRTESHGYAAAAGIAWAFAMYSHNIGRPMSALLLIGFFLCFRRLLLERWRIGLTFVLGFLAALIPMDIWVLHEPQALTGRFKTISIFQDYPSIGEAVARFASRYIEYFDPRFLFLMGDSNLRHHTGHNGELFLFSMPLIAAGLYVIARRSKNIPSSRFVLMGLVIYPIAAALTQDRMHSTRCLNGVIFWLLTAAIGARFLWERRRGGRTLLLVASCAGVFEIGLYMKDFFGPYKIRSRYAFNAAYTEALETCFSALHSNETVHISDSTFALWKIHVTPDFKPVVYIDILFFAKIDPRFYQQHGIPKDRVRLYDGTISRPGVLLRCNMRYVESPYERLWSTAAWADREKMPRPYLFQANYEAIPAEAELLETKPVGGAFRYDIFRVK